MKAIVLDASAVIKWFVKGEEELEEMKLVRDLLLNGEVEIYVPSLLLIEVSNALRYIEGLDGEDVIKAVNALKKLGLWIVDAMELLEDAIKIAFESDITVYDAIYVALARRIRGSLITYDRELLSKHRDLAMKASVFLKHMPR
ncbi:MAG: type II toxin-antitoxin system VapC family toxin [Sulfolobales archaeon]